MKRIILFLLIGIFVVQANAQMSEIAKAIRDRDNNDYVWVSGHRCDWIYSVENSTDALKNAIRSGVDIAETDVELRFIVVEGYASVYNFYVEHNHFHSLKKDENELKELDKIIKHSPERTFYLYLDLKN